MRNRDAKRLFSHETTACAIIWALVEIARHPDIQQRLREEITAARANQAIGESDASMINSLPYLHAFVLELFRLYPSIPLSSKEAKRNLVICDQFIPKGTQIQIPVYAMNRLQDIWGPSAAEFRPERWMKDSQAGETPDSVNKAADLKNLLTFGYGSRSCPGREFAPRVIKSFLVVLLSAFQFEADGENIEFATSLPTIRPMHGAPLYVRPIH
jgi:cytochrome P450